MTKKILAMLLAVLMLVSLITACESGSGTSSTETPTSTTESKTESKTEESKTESTTEELETVDLSIKRDIGIAVGQNTFITDYDDNTLTNTLREAFNCDIEMTVLPAGDDGNTKLQLMVNGGDTLPDVLSYGIGAAYRYEWGTGGTLVALDEYYENPNVMPHFHAIESEADKTNMIANCSASDGHIYAIAMFQPETWNLTPYRTYINTKWMENLGLEEPTTVEELKEVLVAFANDDPNGNGQKDEIAVFTNYVDGGNYGCNVILAMINYFTFTPGSMSSLTVSADGKSVIAPQVSDGWREAMIYLNDLYKEGVIIDNSFIYGTDTTGFKGTLNWQGLGTEKAPEGKSINIVGFFSCGSNSGNFADSGKDGNENFLEYRMLPVMSSANCEGYSPYNAYESGANWSVTTDAEDPAFCTMMGDYCLEFEMSIAVRFGEKDTDWTTDPTYCADWYATHTALIEGAGYEQTKLDYNAFVVKTNTIWSDNTNHFWHNAQPRYMDLETFSYHWGTWTDPETFQYYYGSTLGDTSLAYFSERHPQYYLPTLSYLPEEQDEITDFQILWPDLVMEWTMNFITGSLDPNDDAAWQSYVDEMNNQGLGTYLEMAQAAYERTVNYQSIA